MAEVISDDDLSVHMSTASFFMSIRSSELLAVRHGLRVTNETPVQSLFCLVYCNYDYFDCDYLDAMLERLARHEPELFRQLHDAIFHDEACIQWFENARSALIENDHSGELLCPDQPKGYIKLHHEIMSWQVEKANADTWMNILVGLVKRGVSLTEIDESGLTDFLPLVEADTLVSKHHICRQINHTHLTPVIFVVKASLNSSNNVLSKTDKGIHQRSYMRYSLPQGHNYTEWLFTLPGLRASFYSEHYHVRNVLLHVRTSEREVQGIGRVLLIDELQSDWNQQGRLHGYYDFYHDEHDESTEALPHNPYEKNWADLGIRMMLVMAATNQFDGIAWSPGAIHVERYALKESHGMEVFYDRMLTKIMRNLGKPWKVPLCRMAIATQTRRYTVCREKDKSFTVRVRKDGKVIRAAMNNEDEAWQFQQSLETTIHEIMPGLIFSGQMRHDLIKHGLPYSGSIKISEKTASGHAVMCSTIE